MAYMTMCCILTLVLILGIIGGWELAQIVGPFREGILMIMTIAVLAILFIWGEDRI